MASVDLGASNSNQSGSGGGGGGGSSQWTTNGSSIYYNTGNVGIGVTTPLSPLDIQNSNSANQLHLSGTAADNGLYLGGILSNAGYINAGVSYNGTNWIAKDTTGTVLEQAAGNITFFSDTGLTIGSAYTPTQRWSAYGSGNFRIGKGITDPGIALAFEEDLDNVLGMGRNTANNQPGHNITIQAGGCNPANNDLTGGHLFLTSGIATGVGSSNIYLQTVKGGGSGSTDRVPATAMTVFGNGNVSIPGSLTIGSVSVTGSSTITTNLNVQNTNSSVNINAFTQTLVNAGINIISDVQGGGNGYTPGIFWSTVSAHPDKPKAGIFINANGANGSTMLFGTSNVYATGITTEGLAIDQNGNVGVMTQTPGAAMEVAGALRLTTGSVDSFVTPLGSSVPTKINVPLFDPGAFGQILAMGLPATAAASERVISLLDARTVVHQPTLQIFSPDETHVFGPSWEGTNTTAYIKTDADLSLKVNAIDALHILGASGNINIAGNVAIGSTSASVALEVAGNARAKHVIGGTAAPAIAATGAAGTGPTISITGNDLSGNISVTIGASPPAGIICNVTFNQVYGANPYIVFSAINGSTSSVMANIFSTINSTQFNLNTNVALTSSTVYSWNYHVFQ